MVVFFSKGGGDGGLEGGEEWMELELEEEVVGVLFWDEKVYCDDFGERVVGVLFWGEWDGDGDGDGLGCWGMKWGIEEKGKSNEEDGSDIFVNCL